MGAEELIYGLHAVQAAVKQGTALELLVAGGRHDGRMQGLLRMAQSRNVPITRLSRQELEERVGDGRHQGVAARVELAAAKGEAELLARLDGLDAPPFLLVLDGVQDPHNLGACLRSADAAGVHAVVAPKDKATGLTATARKVASGAAESVPFFQVTNLARTLRALKERNVWLVGAAGEAERELFELDLRGPLALVLGAEEKGLRRLTREACDHLARIPMAGSVSSLNVSVATGVFLFEAVRQRR
jgi:23S rRNA (guanosine2251-2'-O)-methyltransferase